MQVAVFFGVNVHKDLWIVQLCFRLSPRWSIWTISLSNLRRDDVPIFIFLTSQLWIQSTCCIYLYMLTCEGGRKRARERERQRDREIKKTSLDFSLKFHENASPTLLNSHFSLKSHENPSQTLLNYHFNPRFDSVFDNSSHFGPGRPWTSAPSALLPRWPLPLAPAAGARALRGRDRRRRNDKKPCCERIWTCRGFSLPLPDGCGEIKSLQIIHKWWAQKLRATREGRGLISVDLYDYKTY